MKFSIGKMGFDVEWGLVDRLKAVFAPASAAADLQTRMQGAAMEAFKGGSTTRRSMRSFNASPRGPNAALSPQLPTLRARSRYLAHNVPLATGAISTVVTQVVGDGLVLQPKPNRAVLGITEDEAVAWQTRVQNEWELFAKHCDFGKRQNFDGIQALLLRSRLESGDIAVVRRRRDEVGKVYGLRLQLVEADRICNPGGKTNTEKIVDGVELDDDGAPVALHISNVHPGEGLAAKREVRRYEITGSATAMPLILFLGDQMRPGQVRGAPYLAPVIDAIKQLGDYADAEMHAAIVAAMFTVFVEQETPDEDGHGLGTTGVDGVDDTTEIALGSGAVVGLNPGEKANIANPGRPNASFEAFVDAVSREIGVALQLPKEVLLKSFTASYSASRAALEMAWQFFRERRSWLAWNFCQPVYEWFLTEAVARGRIAAPGFFADPAIREAWLGADWVGPSRIQLDPQKEAVADQLDLAMGVTTRERIILERKGGNFADTHAQLVKEQQMRDRDGLITPAANTGFGATEEKQKPDDGDDSKAEASMPAVNVTMPAIEVHTHMPRRGTINKTFKFDAAGKAVGMIEEEQDEQE